MRKLFDELFYIPKHGTGKIREKAFLSRIAVSVFAILFCLSAMGITAYAWFAGNIVSSTNTIAAANYDLDWDITVKGTDGNDQTSSYVEQDTVELNGADAQEYVVKIQLGQNCTASTGFCVMEVDYQNENGTYDGIADETYHTAQIGKDVRIKGEDPREPYTLYIRLDQAAKIKFSPCWGTSPYYSEDDAADNRYYLTDGKTTKDNPLVLSKSNETPPSQNKEEQKTTTTTVSTVTTTSGHTSDTTASTTSTTTTSTEQTTSPIENTETTGASTTEASE